ncbi:hypothetical protein CLV62_1379 [Dysgonomonas alginatilytica]|uniref:Uncharacterized protein n=1 Tax=Dysgonomonas alginatilytica TaxID=1605892 RepID=A0A2V3PL51_9BACT|nr:hypothetical protein CLV62_1379 [Dysgonomonas alginatilytica]
MMVRMNQVLNSNELLALTEITGGKKLIIIADCHPDYPIEL